MILVFLFMGLGCLVSREVTDISVIANDRSVGALDQLFARVQLEAVPLLIVDGISIARLGNARNEQLLHGVVPIGLEAAVRIILLVVEEVLHDIAVKHLITGDHREVDVEAALIQVFLHIVVDLGDQS